jgi:hypothetical protein
VKGGGGKSVGSGAGTIVDGTAVGVPETYPVLASKTKPAGRSGLTLYVLPVGIVVLFTGAFVVIFTPAT